MGLLVVVRSFRRATLREHLAAQLLVGLWTELPNLRTSNNSLVFEIFVATHDDLPPLPILITSCIMDEAGFILQKLFPVATLLHGVGVLSDLLGAALLLVRLLHLSRHLGGSAAERCLIVKWHLLLLVRLSLRREELIGVAEWSEKWPKAERRWWHHWSW